MTEMRTVTVSLAERSYPIYIGPDLLARRDLLASRIRGRQVAIVTNETVAPLYLDSLKAALGGFEIKEIVLPDGEQHKTLEAAAGIYDALLAERFERSCTLIALGGGVVGDMAGFAAATYLRGVDYIQVPTTLLAQVDSSVGGKTGVNRPLGKNMVGAFHQPRCVLADTETLGTLPDRELRAGMAEVIKYALINNPGFYQWLGEHGQGVLTRRPRSLAHAIGVSCEEKAAIVARDEKEGGVRAILNFGHTFGHVIEAAVGYGNWLHGEAVAAGMVMAADLSRRLGLISGADARGIKALIAEAGLPTAPPEAMDARDFTTGMSHDKKAAGGHVRFVLLEGIGRAVVRGDVAPELLEQTLSAGEALAE